MSDTKDPVSVILAAIEQNGGKVMNRKLRAVVAALLYIVFPSFVGAQDLGPQFQKIKDGIYVYVGKEFNSNAGIVLTEDGVVLIDSGHNPTDSRAILDAVKKLTSLPLRFLIDTEPHGDHTTGHFVFSPPAVIIAHEVVGDQQLPRRRYLY